MGFKYYGNSTQPGGCPNQQSSSGRRKRDTAPESFGEYICFLIQKRIKELIFIFFKTI